MFAVNMNNLSQQSRGSLLCSELSVCVCVCGPQYDLVNTIGEAAALGAAGVVSWGDMDITDTEVMW